MGVNADPIKAKPFLYHVSPAENTKSILKNGIVRKGAMVYLSEDWRSWYQPGMQVFVIETARIPKTIEMHTLLPESDEIFVFGDIPPEAIRPVPINMQQIESAKEQQRLKIIKDGIYERNRYHPKRVAQRINYIMHRIKNAQEERWIMDNLGKMINELRFQLNSKEVKEHNNPIQLSATDARKILNLLLKQRKRKEEEERAKEKAKISFLCGI